MATQEISREAFDAQTVEEFAVANRIGRTKAYAEIASGRLKARKVGARTIITGEDAEEWRRNLPLAVPAKTCTSVVTASAPVRSSRNQTK